MKRWRIVIMVAVFALLAAACASSGDGTTTTAAPSGGGDTTTTTAAPSGGGDATTTTAGGGESTDGYQQLANAEAGEYSGTSVTIQGQWVDDEETAFAGSLADFAARTGIEITYEGVTDHETVLTVRVEGGDAPDIAQIAQPGAMRAYAEAGDLVAFDSFMNLDQLNTDYSAAWTTLGKAGDETYGVFYKAATKSIVWYPVAPFEAAGYTIPTTWDEMTALTDQITADGGIPWCLSIEHGDASGWVATDWLEDILLRNADTATYDAWVAHEIPFNDPAVLDAAAIMNDIWFTDGSVLGGNAGINAIFIGDAPKPMFDEGGPGCWLHRQASWISDFFGKDPATEENLYEPGVDAKFFYLPSIKGDAPVLGGGDLFMMFNDRPEVQAVIEYLATAEAAKVWAQSGGFISPNNSVPIDWYTDYSSAEQAAILAGATSLSFDGSDNMPAEVGNGTFWSGMVDWVAANGEDTEGVFQGIEDSWPQQ